MGVSRIWLRKPSQLQIFPQLCFSLDIKRYLQICEAILVPTGMNGLTMSTLIKLNILNNLHSLIVDNPQVGGLLFNSLLQLPWDRML